MKKLFHILALLLLATLNFHLSTAFAQGTAFTYQGRLNDVSNPANGNYDLRFAVYNAAAVGSVAGGPVTNAATAVTNGLFTVTLDFGSGVFDGSARWLEIAVRTNGATGFATLTPRQPLTPAPYAILAGTASGLSGTLPVNQVVGVVPLAQLPAAVLTNCATGVSLSGFFTGNGGGLTGLNPANLSAGTAAISITGNSATATTAATATNACNVVDGAGNVVGYSIASYTTNFASASWDTNHAYASGWGDTKYNGTFTCVPNSYPGMTMFSNAVTGAFLVATNDVANGANFTWEFGNADYILIGQGTPQPTGSPYDLTPTNSLVWEDGLDSFTNIGTVSIGTNAISYVITTNYSFYLNGTVATATYATNAGTAATATTATTAMYATTAATATNAMTAATSQGSYIHSFPRIPARYFNTWFMYGGNLSNLTEITISNTIKGFIASGLAGALSTPQQPAIFWIDDGVYGSRLDTNGALQLDPTRFPSGYGVLASWCHTNGLLLGMYVNAGISGGSPLSPAIRTWTTISATVNNFGSFGVDAIKYDYLDSSSFSIACVGMMNTAIMQQYHPMQLLITDPYLSENPWSSWELSGMASAANYLETGQGGPAGNPLTVTNAYQNLAAFWRHEWVNQPGCVIETGEFSRSISPVAAKAVAALLATSGSDFYIAETNPAAIACITNANFLAIQGDSGWMPGTNAIHFSSGAVEDAWIRPLGPVGMTGLYSNSVSFWNFSSTNYTFTLSATNFGWPAGSTMNVLEAWNNTNFTATGTITMTVATNDTDLIIVSLVPNLPAAQLTGTIPLANENPNVVTHTATGVTLTGAFTGNGGGLTNLQAAQLTGTIPLANENPNVVTNTETGVTLTGTFTGNGASVTNLNANNLASGTVPLARLSGITSNQLDAATWQLATNLNGGNAATATTAGMATNAYNIVDGAGNMVGYSIPSSYVTYYFYSWDTNHVYVSGETVPALNVIYTYVPGTAPGITLFSNSTTTAYLVWTNDPNAGFYLWELGTNNAPDIDDTDNTPSCGMGSPYDLTPTNCLAWETAGANISIGTNTTPVVTTNYSYSLNGTAQNAYNLFDSAGNVVGYSAVSYTTNILSYDTNHAYATGFGNPNVDVMLTLIPGTYASGQTCFTNTATGAYLIFNHGMGTSWELILGGFFADTSPSIAYGTGTPYDFASTNHLMVWSGGTSNDLVLLGTNSVSITTNYTFTLNGVAATANTAGIASSVVQYGIDLTNLDNASYLAYQASIQNNAYLNFNRGAWKHTATKIAAGQPIRMELDGNGLVLLGALDSAFFNLTNILNIAGCFSPCTPYVYAPTATAGYTSGCDSNWFNAYSIFTNNASTVQIVADSFKWNVLELDFVVRPTGASFKVQTNEGSFGQGTWVDTGFTFTATNSSVVGKSFFWTNSSPMALDVNLVQTSSGSNYFVNYGAWNNTITNAILIGKQAHSSSGIANEVCVPASIKGPIYSNWSPDIILWLSLESPATLSNAFFQWLSFYTNWCPQADIVICGVYPIAQNESLLQTGNVCERSNCVVFANSGVDISYFDGWSPFVDPTNFFNRGWLSLLTDVHGTTGPFPQGGYSAYGFLLTSWLDLAGAKIYGNSTTFVGNGSGLTNLPAAQLTGTIPLANENPNVVTNTATGVTLTGTFTGNGGGLTNLQAAQLTGTIPLANENPNVVTNTETGVTLTGTFTGNGASVTNLNANNLASGTVPLARLSGITSNQLDAATWQLATNLNGGNAATATTATNGPDGNPLATYTVVYPVTTNLLPWITGSGWGDINVNTLSYLTNNSWVSTNGVILIYANLGDGAFEVSNVLTKDWLYYNPVCTSSNVTDSSFFVFGASTWQTDGGNSDGATPIGLFTQNASYTTNTVKVFSGNASYANSAGLVSFGPDGFPLLTTLNQTVSNQVFSVTFRGGDGGWAGGSNALWLMAGPSPTALQVASNAPVFLSPNGGALRDPCVIKYGEKYLLYYAVFASNAPMTLGVAESKNRIQWQFDGYIVPATNYDGSTNHNFSSPQSGFDNSYLFVDATNGLHVIVNVEYGAGNTNYTVLGDINPNNPTNITNIRQIFFGGESIGNDVQCGPIYYTGGHYYLFTGSGHEYVNATLATNGWNRININLCGEGPALINWGGLYWLITTWGWGQAETSPDLTNWTAVASETSLAGWGNGNSLWSDTPIYNGAFQGDGSGLTNLQAAQLTGTIPLANENPNVVTNTATGVTLTGAFTGDGGGLTNLNANNLASGTVPLARLSGITSNQLDAATWQLATNLNGGNAATATTATNGPDGNPLATYTPVDVVTTNLLPRMTGSGWGNTNVNTLYQLTNNSWVSTNGVILIYANLQDGAYEVSNVLTQDFLYYNPFNGSTNVTDITFFTFTGLTWQTDGGNSDGVLPIGLFTPSMSFMTNTVKVFNGNSLLASNANTAAYAVTAGGSAVSELSSNVLLGWQTIGSSNTDNQLWEDLIRSRVPYAGNSVNRFAYPKSLAKLQANHGLTLLVEGSGLLANGMYLQVWKDLTNRYAFGGLVSFMGGGFIGVNPQNSAGVTGCPHIYGDTNFLAGYDTMTNGTTVIFPGYGTVFTNDVCAVYLENTPLAGNVDISQMTNGSSYIDVTGYSSANMNGPIGSTVLAWTNPWVGPCVIQVTAHSGTNNLLGFKCVNSSITNGITLACYDANGGPQPNIVPNSIRLPIWTNIAPDLVLMNFLGVQENPTYNTNIGPMLFDYYKTNFPAVELCYGSEYPYVGPAGNPITQTNTACLAVACEEYGYSFFDEMNVFGPDITNACSELLARGYQGSDIHATSPQGWLFHGSLMSTWLGLVNNPTTLGNFTGAFTGNGGGLTNLSANAIAGGLTTNLAVLVPGGGTNMLCFTNGVLRAVR